MLISQKKQCFKCGHNKPLAEYYAHKMMADGHLNKCKACAKRDVRKHREQNIERIREYDRRRSCLPHRVALVKRYQSRLVTVTKCHRRFHNAVARGKLTRKPCEVCREPRVDGHHDDYLKPLSVRWLCRKHHREHHVKHGPGKNYG